MEKTYDSESESSIADGQYDMLDDLSEISDDHDTASIASHGDDDGQPTPDDAQSHADDDSTTENEDVVEVSHISEKTVTVEEAEECPNLFKLIVHTVRLPHWRTWYLSFLGLNLLAALCMAFLFTPTSRMAELAHPLFGKSITVPAIEESVLPPQKEVGHVEDVVQPPVVEDSPIPTRNVASTLNDVAALGQETIAILRADIQEHISGRTLSDVFSDAASVGREAVESAREYVQDRITDGKVASMLSNAAAAGQEAVANLREHARERLEMSCGQLRDRIEISRQRLWDLKKVAGKKVTVAAKA